MSEFDQDWLPTRQTLLSRLKDWDDAESWREFFESYSKLIYGVARRSGLSDSDAQEVVQETLVTVANKIPDFKYDPNKGSFKEFLIRERPFYLSKVHPHYIGDRISDCKYQNRGNSNILLEEQEC